MNNDELEHICQCVETAEFVRGIQGIVNATLLHSDSESWFIASHFAMGAISGMCDRVLEETEGEPNEQ